MLAVILADLHFFSAHHQLVILDVSAVCVCNFFNFFKSFFNLKHRMHLREGSVYFIFKIYFLYIFFYV